MGFRSVGGHVLNPCLLAACIKLVRYDGRKERTTVE